MNSSDILKLIGRTPLVELKKIQVSNSVRVFCKLEYFNPGKSVKDRAAFFMIEGAYSKGLLSSSSYIVEPTSGNTGIGLAWICATRKIPLVLVMPEHMSEERKKLLKYLGAQLILTPKEKGMKGAVEKVQDIVQSDPKAVFLNQFNNSDNVRAHYTTTGVEIWEDLGNQIDVLVAGVGTAGTIVGVSTFIKERKKIHVFAVEPLESPVLSGGKPGPHNIPGIGAGFIPGNYIPSLVDEIITVPSEEALKTAKTLALIEGIPSGISGGANVWAALQVANRPEFKNKTIVTFIPDFIERYLSVIL
ncbi:MAG: cysteine synthase A [Bacteroidales bacterium]|nr:cysteine synthase A [Bacteroidales bacterium]